MVTIQKSLQTDAAVSHGVYELLFVLFQAMREIFGNLHERLYVYPFVL